MNPRRHLCSLAAPLLLLLMLARAASSQQQGFGALLAKELGYSAEKGDQLVSSIPASRQLVADAIERQQWAQALEAADGLLKELASRIENTNNQMMLTWLASLRYDRLEVLKRLGRNVEAFREALYLRYDCITFHVCDRSIAEDQMRDLGRFIERGLYGHPPARSPKHAWKQMMLIVHPDKNQKLDADSLQWLANIFDKIKLLYDSA